MDANQQSPDDWLDGCYVTARLLASQEAHLRVGSESAKRYERCPGKLFLVVADTANLISDLRV